MIEANAAGTCGAALVSGGQKKAHGAKNAGSARDEDATDLKLPRKACRMQGAGATKCDESIVARIVTTLDRDHPDRARHVGGDHGNDALGRLNRREDELVG